MSKLEITLTKNKLTVRREAEERLTREQRYTALLVLICCTAAVTFFFILFACTR